MKKPLKSCAFLLAILLTACSPALQQTETTVPPETSTLPAESNTESAETVRADAKDKLPADLNLNGETINIFARNSDSVLKFDVIGTDHSGDIVYDAVWSRNEAVKERLNVNLNIIPSQSTNLSGLRTEMQTVVMSGSGDFDVFITSNNSIVPYGMITYLRVLNDAPYLDFDAPWWWTESMQNLSLDGKTIQYLIGDMLPQNILTSAVVYVNKDIWQDNFGDPEQIYDMVTEGKWTLDLFAEYSRKVYKDVNGDGKLDSSDTVGFYGNEYQTIDYLAAGSNVFNCTRNEDGFACLNPPDERTIAFTEKLINLFYNENAASIAAHTDETKMIPAFTEGRCLFLPDVLLSSTKAEMRDMESDYAIIPVPKYDETQENYLTLIYGHSTNASIPLTVNDTKYASVSAVLEALGAESYRSLTETLYETALKGKYARDAKSAQMLDLIISSTCKDFANEYGSVLNNLLSLLHNAIAQKNMVLTSQYEALAPAAQAGLDNLLKELEKIQ